jgi:hypothetical protein
MAAEAWEASGILQRIGLTFCKLLFIILIIYFLSLFVTRFLLIIYFEAMRRKVTHVESASQLTWIQRQEKLWRGLEFGTGFLELPLNLGVSVEETLDRSTTLAPSSDSIVEKNSRVKYVIVFVMT